MFDCKRAIFRNLCATFAICSTFGSIRILRDPIFSCMVASIDQKPRQYISKSYLENMTRAIS